MAPSPPRPANRQGGPQATGQGPSAAQKGKEEKQPGTFFLGRYRVVDEIGVGGMASVHLARMDGPGGFQKWVAIKRIHPHLVEDDQFVDMFLDEARIAAGINHANVAQVFDLGKDDNTYWIAMEYLHGEPLREIMRRVEERRTRVTPDLAARICSDAAEGLHAAHELRGKNGHLLGLVHRDVTPHNLFLTYDGYTKVVDFGIAKVADRLSQTRAGTLKGKLAYMSPEQVRGAEVDRTTDIFALGVVLWELTTNQRLFRMDTDLDTLEKVQACVVPAPSSLVNDYPMELEGVVLKALAKRKQDRFQTAREFSRALQNFLMKQGSFVGSEEVASFVRGVFADRIQKREAHLAWAAEVTSTINVEHLRSGAIHDDLSVTEDPNGRRKAPIPAAGAPALPPSVPMPVQSAAQAPPMMQGSAVAPMMPRQDAGFAPPPARVQPAPPRAVAAAPAPSPPMPAPPMSAAQPQMAATSLMDDDEDVPTTVAMRNEPEAPRAAPRPAAGAAPTPDPYAQQPAYSQAYGAPPGRPANGTIPFVAGQQQAAAFAPRPPPRFAGAAAVEPEDMTAALPGQESGFGGQSGAYDAAGAAQSGTRPQPGFAQSGSRPIADFNAYGAQAPGFAPGANRPPSAGQNDLGSTVALNVEEAGAAQFNAFSGQTGMPAPATGARPGFNGPSPATPGAPGLPPAFTNSGFGPGSQPGSAQFPGAPQSQIETALSLPRPDPAALWLAQQEKQRGERRNTGVLIAVVALTALCVIGIAALIYFKVRTGTAPIPAPADSALAGATSASASPSASPSASASVAPSATDSATTSPSAVPNASSAVVAQTAPSTSPSPSQTQTSKTASTGTSAPTSTSTSTSTSTAGDKEEPGFLTIVCNPYCDEVIDQGRSLGPSPIVHLSVRPGQHRITLKKSGQSKTISVIVVSGQVTAQRVAMK